MGMLKGLLRNKSVLKKYIASYMMFAALICSVTGIAIFSVSAHEINQVAAEEIEKRIQGIADNIDTQMEVMQGIAHEIASLPEYKLSYIEKHKFREVEMLDSLKKYGSYTPLISRFFLLYRGKDSAYLLPDRTTSRFSVMATIYMGCGTTQEAEALYEEILSLKERTVIRLGNDNLLFCYPISHDYMADATAFVSFIADRNKVGQQIALIGGSFEGEIRLTWRDRCVYGQAGGGSAWSACMGKSGVGVELVSEGGLPYSGLIAYASIFWCVMIAAFALACVLAIMTAKKAYRPIRELMNGFAGKTPCGEDEFNAIQRLLKQSLENNRITQEQLQERMAWLERQHRQNEESMAMLALTGNLHFLPQLSAEESHLFEEGRRFGVICIAFQDKCPLDALFDQIAEMGDREVQLCAVHLPYEALIAVVVSFSGAHDMSFAAELLRELLDALEIRAALSAGTITDTYNHIPDSFAAAVAGLRAETRGVRDARREWYDEAILNQLLLQIREGQSEQARESLALCFDQIEEANPSVLIRSCAYSDVINAIIRFAAKNGIRMPEDNLSVVLLYNQPSKIRERSFALLDRLCADFQNQKDERDDDCRALLLAHIQTHFREYGLCLAEMEETFGLSVRRIEQIVRAETGMTFKEYLTKLRMDEAKRLLGEGMSVKDTSQAVCYMSVSFFIRTFKKCVGMTPAEYRKSVETP